MRAFTALALWFLCTTSSAASDTALKKSTLTTISTTRITTITKLSTTRASPTVTSTIKTTTSCPYPPSSTPSCHTTCPQSTIDAGSQTFTRDYSGCQVYIYQPQFVEYAEQFLDSRLPDCRALQVCADFAISKKAPGYLLTFIYTDNPCGYQWWCQAGSFPAHPLYRPNSYANGFYAYRVPDSTSSSTRSVSTG